MSLPPWMLPSKLPPKNEDRSSAILSSEWVLFGLATLCLSARLFTKVRITKRIYLDDGLMILALITGLLHTVFATLSVQNGFGKHFIYLSTHDQMESIRWGLHCIPWGNISPTFGRISVCITFLYLTQIDRSTMRWPLWLFIVLQAIFNIAYVVAFYYQASAWLSPEFNPLAPNARWNTEVQLAMGYFVGAFNCLTDAFLTVWPAMLISRSRLALRKRIGLGFLLCMSVVALVAAIAKTHSVKSLNEPSDYTYTLAMYAIWLSVELNVVIIVASIPLSRALFRRQQQTPELGSRSKWDNVTLGSIVSKAGSHTKTRSFVSESEEHIVPAPLERHDSRRSTAITVTREVTVTYESSNVPFVHAALVGLVQGEIYNPHLVRR